MMIARAAEAGIQVIVETHSNHVLNGILMASKRFEEEGIGIDRNNVKLYYMKKAADGLQSVAEEVKIVGDG